MKPGKVIHIILLAVLSFPSLATGDVQDSPGGRRSGFLALPVLFYSPETKLAGGGAVNYYFRESGSADASRPSIIMPSIIYTQQRQIMSEISADIYWQDEAWRLVGYMGYKKFPDKFYGIGNDTPESNEESYTPLTARIRMSVQKRIYPGLYVGVRYEFEHNKLIETETDGLLARGDVPGSRGGTTSGVGVLAILDSRNNVFFPTTGSYCQLTVNLFHGVLASDYGFNIYRLDLRRYVSLASQVIAVQGYASITTGEPPFRKMSMLGDRIGGSNLMRGYYEGRFRDRDMLAFQVEYRLTPLWRRLGLVAFAGFGDVADRVKNFELRSFKFAIGGGVRFMINREEKLNLRLDLAYGADASGVYITIGEAF